MSRGVNRVTLLGRLGRDPETKQFQNGGQVTNISLATEEVWKDKQSGEQQSRTEWHRVSFFGRLSEIADQYLNKGSQCYVEGKLQTRKWQDQSGADRYSTEVIARELQLLGSPGNNQGSEQENNNRGGGEYSGEDSSSQTRSQPRSQPAAPPMNADFEDDIPF